MMFTVCVCAKVVVIVKVYIYSASDITHMKSSVQKKSIVQQFFFFRKFKGY